jgi:hypothetical protein
MPYELSKVYWVAGKGPMLLIELPSLPAKTTFTMETSAGHMHWVAAQELSIITPDELRFHVEQLEASVKMKPDSERGRGMAERILRMRQWSSILARQQPGQ